MTSAISEPALIPTTPTTDQVEKEKKQLKIDNSSALIKHLNEIIKNPKYCDTLFIVGDKKTEIFSNSLLLRQSKVLEKLLLPKDELKQNEKKKPEHAKSNP